MNRHSTMPPLRIDPPSKEMEEFLERGRLLMERAKQEMRQQRFKGREPMLRNRKYEADTIPTIDGITVRDLNDCFVRGFLLSAGHVVPELYEEAKRGQEALINPSDLYVFNLNELDPMAVFQNMVLEIARLTGTNLWPEAVKTKIETPDNSHGSLTMTCSRCGMTESVPFSLEGFLAGAALWGIEENHSGPIVCPECQEKEGGKITQDG